MLQLSKGKGVRERTGGERNLALDQVEMLLKSARAERGGRLSWETLVARLGLRAEI